MGELPGGERKTLDLAQAAQTLLNECRMVLPGIQAIFGFQLTTVFEPPFQDSLSKPDQVLHLAAMCFVALAVALVMTPAAYHRSRGAREVSGTFIYLSSALLLAGMVALASGLSMDVFVIGKVILEGPGPALAVALGFFAVFMFFWFGFTHMTRLHRAIVELRR